MDFSLFNIFLFAVVASHLRSPSSYPEFPISTLPSRTILRQSPSCGKLTSPWPRLECRAPALGPAQPPDLYRTRVGGWDGVETGALAVQYGGESRRGALLKAPVSYPALALTCQRARPKMARIGRKNFPQLRVAAKNSIQRSTAWER